MNGRGRFNVPSCFVNEPTPPKKMQVKKKFNHTALYTGIVSSRHSHLHGDNGPGSTVPPGPMSSRFLVGVPVSGSVFPRLCCPGGPGTAQVWSPLKADKTHHALAFFCVLYFVCLFFSSKS